MTAAADRAAMVADRTDPEQAMLAAYLPGAARVVEGRPDLGAPLVHQAIELLESDPVLRDDPRHLVVSLLCARWLMDPSSALGYAERRINRAREAGALGVLATGLSLFAGGLTWMGDHVRAYAFARRGGRAAGGPRHHGGPGGGVRSRRDRECLPRPA